MCPTNITFLYKCGSLTSRSCQNRQFPLKIKETNTRNDITFKKKVTGLLNRTLKFKKDSVAVIMRENPLTWLKRTKVKTDNRKSRFSFSFVFIKGRSKIHFIATRLRQCSQLDQVWTTLWSKFSKQNLTEIWLYMNRLGYSEKCIAFFFNLSRWVGTI